MLDRSKTKTKMKMEALDPSVKTQNAYSLAKNLASCNKTTRDKSMRLLKAYLSSREQQQISSEELKKIWKGLFFCVWHADKQPVQLELTNGLASLLVTLDLPLSINFFQIFLLTIRREWSGIDCVRLDKFYLLNRRFLHHFFLLLKNNYWEMHLLSNLMGILRDQTLISDDKYPAQGLNYHLAEIFLSELRCFLPLKPETIDVLLQPFCCVLDRSSDKVLINKVKVNVLDCLLENGLKFLKVKGGDHVELSEDVGKFGAVALTAGLSKKLFNLASSSDSLQGNRKVLFDLHEGFLKLENERAKMGHAIMIPMIEEPKNFKNSGVEKLVDDDCINKVQDLVACQGTVQEGAERVYQSTKKLRKKSKKALSKKISDARNKKARAKSISLSDSESHGGISIVNNEGNDASGVKNQNDIDNGDGSLMNARNPISFDEPVISNIHKQLEKAAAEAGMDMGSPSLNGITVPVINSGSRKRKTMKNVNGKVSHNPVPSNEGVDGIFTSNNGEKIAKKVSFCMKSNLIWKPHSPLPPQSLRLPPLATPRGSALKKGIPPGPVCLVKESPTLKKRKRKAKYPLKKGRKNSTSVSPAIKRLRKLQANSV